VGRPIQEEVTDPPRRMEEVAISENNHGGARLPTFNRRKIRSEVRVPEGRGDAKSSAPMEGLREGSIHLLRNPPSLERPERREESKNSKKSSGS
jgi:hypothetical protein